MRRYPHHEINVPPAVVRLGHESGLAAVAFKPQVDVLCLLVVDVGMCFDFLTACFADQLDAAAELDSGKPDARFPANGIKDLVHGTVQVVA